MMLKKLLLELLVKLRLKDGKDLYRSKDGWGVRKVASYKTSRECKKAAREKNKKDDGYDYFCM